MLWLPEDCRKAGLDVVEITGWETRGTEFTAMPTTVLCHHTATPATARGDLPTKKLLVEGRSPKNPAAPDHLPGPLCQVGLGRSGTVYVVASGRANHAGKGAWKGETSSARTLGIEAEHPGVGPWPQPQLDAYLTLVAVLLRGIGQTSERAAGHKEWALPKGRKTDPNFDMAPFRRAVKARLEQISGQAQVDPQPVTPTDWDEMATKDEIRAVVAEELAKAVAKLHDDHVVILRGTSSGTHPNNLTNIGKAVGVPQ